MKHIFIVNPVAGKRNVNEVIKVIEQTCKSYNIDHDIVMTTSIGDALEKAHAIADENTIVYSVGGDGTLNEVVNGLTMSDATLGIIPNGSGNDFFRMLSDDKEDIIDRTINGFIEPIDIGKVNNYHFINIASIGYDAEVAVNASIMKNKKIIPNNMIYYASIFYTLLSFKSPRVEIMFNNMTIDQQITLLAICNGKFYGNGIPISPRSKIDDNLLDLYLVDKISKAKIPYLLTQVLKGVHEKYRFVNNYQTDHIKIVSEYPLNCNIDGEIITSDKFEFGISKSKMKIIRPKKTTFLK